jgi:hypothetical protein
MSIAEAVREETPLAQAAESTAAPQRRRWYVVLWFWIKRYAPPEIAGTATMVAGGMLVSALGAPVWLVGLVGALAESLGFYAVAGIGVWREQRQAFPGRGRPRILLRVLGLLIVEFGPAELLDTFLVRPIALTLGVQLLPHVAAGLIAGKAVADVAFYVLAAVAFRVSQRTGIRGS